MARSGKIARLPHDLRTEVNTRLRNGETARQILAWLNSQPAAVAVWEREFEGAPASPQNLSEWRIGGYREWEERAQRVENLKTLSTFAHDLTRSGGHIADGAAAILSGQILEALEQAGNLVVTGGSDDAEKDPIYGLGKMACAVAALQKSSVARSKLDLDKKRVAQKDRQYRLDVKKFEMQSVEKFMQFLKSPEAIAIAESTKPKNVKMAELRELMFGPVKGKEDEDATT